MKLFTLSLAVAGALLVSAAPSTALGTGAQPAATTKPLQIYVVDTEGGKAALWVSPTRPDACSSTAAIPASATPIASWRPSRRRREADRLPDHARTITSITSAACRNWRSGFRSRHFIDHGPTVEEREQVPGFQAAYAELYGKAKHTVVKPGDSFRSPASTGAS